MVQLDNNKKYKIYKYDQDNNLIKEYNSLNECVRQENIQKTTLKKHIISQNLLNGFLFKTDENINNGSFILTKCSNCGNDFWCESWRIEKRKHIFCSKKCNGEFDKVIHMPNCKCIQCGKEYYVKPSHKIKSKYCSKKCQNKHREQYMQGVGNHQYGLKGNNNASWKSDERISYYGYKLIRNIHHPFKNCDDFVFEHRLIAEKYLLTSENAIEINNQLYLHPDYIVHHIDFNRLNNDVLNLRIMLRSEHTSMHQLLNNNIEEFKKYCMDNFLDFNIVYNTHLYNCEKYKYVG